MSRLCWGCLTGAIRANFLVQELLHAIQGFIAGCMEHRWHAARTACRVCRESGTGLTRVVSRLRWSQQASFRRKQLEQTDRPPTCQSYSARRMDGCRDCFAGAVESAWPHPADSEHRPRVGPGAPLQDAGSGSKELERASLSRPSSLLKSYDYLRALLSVVSGPIWSIMARGEAQVLDGLAALWEEVPAVRRQLLWEGQILVWADPSETGVPSYKNASMNYDALLPFFKKWCSGTQMPKTPKINPIQKEARMCGKSCLTVQV